MTLFAPPSLRPSLNGGIPAGLNAQGNAPQLPNGANINNGGAINPNIIIKLPKSPQPLPVKTPADVQSINKIDKSVPKKENPIQQPIKQTPQKKKEEKKEEKKAPSSEKPSASGPTRKAAFDKTFPATQPPEVKKPINFGGGNIVDRFFPKPDLDAGESLLDRLKNFNPPKEELEKTTEQGIQDSNKYSKRENAEAKTKMKELQSARTIIGSQIEIDTKNKKKYEKAESLDKLIADYEKRDPKQKNSSGFTNKDMLATMKKQRADVLGKEQNLSPQSVSERKNELGGQISKSKAKLKEAEAGFTGAGGIMLPNNGLIVPRTGDTKGRLASSVKEFQAEEENRKQFAQREAEVEAMKPKGKPRTPQETLQQNQYETAKKNLAYEKARLANKKSETLQIEAGSEEVVKYGQEEVVKADSEKKLARREGELRAAEAVVRLDEQIKGLETTIKENPNNVEAKQKLEIAKGSRTDFAKIATGGDEAAAIGLDSESAKTLRDQLKAALQEGLSINNANQTVPVKKTSDQDQAEQKKQEISAAPKTELKKPEIQSTAQNPLEQTKLAVAAPKAEQDKQQVVQQNDSQTFSSILGAVNQILQYISNPDSLGATKDQVGKLGSTGSSSPASASTSNVNVSTPVNISVGNGADSGAAENAANQIAQLVSQAISQMEPQIKKIATDAATAAANKVAGNKVPPTQGMYT
jgi:hypothetical protein